MNNKKDKDEKFKEYWEDSMKKGRRNFALLNGFIAGVILFGLALLAFYLFTGTSFLAFDLNTFISFLICYFAGFLFFYIFVWNVNSFKYHVMLKKGNKHKRKK